jgi:hypothetical protein
MDQYFLSKDEWDTLIELGVDSHKDELVLKKISTATKTSLTRKYVAAARPVYRQRYSLSPDTTPENTQCHSTKAKIWASSPRSSPRNQPQTLRRPMT